MEFESKSPGVFRTPLGCFDHPSYPIGRDLDPYKFAWLHGDKSHGRIRNKSHRKKNKSKIIITQFFQLVGA